MRGRGWGQCCSNCWNLSTLGWISREWVPAQQATCSPHWDCCLLFQTDWHENTIHWYCNCNCLYSFCHWQCIDAGLVAGPMGMCWRWGSLYLGGQGGWRSWGLGDEEPAGREEGYCWCSLDLKMLCCLGGEGFCIGCLLMGSCLD